MTQKFYPASQISRSLDPSQKSFTTVVGRHDRRLTDADINLIQDVQDAKRKALLDNTLFSGVVSYKPFVFHSNVENTFTIPAFDVLFNGDMVTIGGFKSSDMGSNRISIPRPAYWTYGQDPSTEMKIYVVFLELWYRNLNPETGEGYYVDPSDGSRYFYPNGCTGALKANLIADDVFDPFDKVNTTSRVQIQWSIRVAELPWSYDFDKYRFGLDQGPNVSEVVYGQSFLSTQATLDGYQFSNLGNVNGDFGLWRSGVSDPLSTLQTLDGFSYAMPLAVLSQRNAGPYSIDENPFGSMDHTVPNSGLLGFGISGRPDGKFADVIYTEDVVDTRLVTQLKDADPDELLKRGFSDLVTGKASWKISRGDGVGSREVSLGSEIPFSVHLGPTPHSNSAYIGTFDGFMNGFSSEVSKVSASRILFVSEKASGVKGQRWAKNDSLTLSLGSRPGTIKTVTVQSTVLQSDGSLGTTLLYTGQILVTGLGTTEVTISFAMNPLGTQWDPEGRPLLVSLGIEYPAGSDYDLRVVPRVLCGGELDDPSVGALPVYGVSEYEIKRDRPAESLTIYNPSYSSTSFGTHYLYRAPSSAGVTTTESGRVVTTFTLNNTYGKLVGTHVYAVTDLVSGAPVNILRRKISGNALIVVVAADFTATPTSLQFDIQCVGTAQVGYNAPTKGVLAIEEVVYLSSASSTRSSDPRCPLLDITKTVSGNKVLVGSHGCVIKGIAGDANGNKILFLKNGADYDAHLLSDVQIFEGAASLFLPDTTVNLETTEWFVIASILPSLSPLASIQLTAYYIPYQGEGVEGREYSVIHSEDTAILTTNGTGSKPVIGLRDVFPFDRELPLSVSLPSQPNWADSDLTNQPLEVLADSNYEAKRLSNVEHTVQVPLHTNDFIEPLTGWKRKKIKLSVQGARGFSKAYPHVGFAVRKPQSKNVLGSSVMATAAPITLYVNNVLGSDSNDGSTKLSPKKTIQGALTEIPSVIKHPVTICLLSTGEAYHLGGMQAVGQIQAAVIGDGKVRPIKHYCVANLSYEIQASGRLLITRESSIVPRVEISAADYIPMGDGALSAFVVDGSRAIFNGIKFTNFGIDLSTNPAVKVLDSNVEFVNCEWENNLQAGSVEGGSSIILSDCVMSLPAGAVGMVCTSSSLSSVGTKLVATAGSGSFYVMERGSDLTLREHSPSDETGVVEGTTIVLAKINSSVSCSSDFSSKGKAVVVMNSILTRPVSNKPFQGEVSTDETSSVTTDTV